MAHFCTAAWDLTWHPGNEHPGNGGAETLSGQKKKTIWFVIIQGIQPLIIVCNGELKSIKTKHWGGHWLSLSITTFLSAVACALSWQRQFPATQELATQRAETRGRPHWMALLWCWDLPQGKILQKRWLCSQEATNLKTKGIEHNCLGDRQVPHICMCSCLPPLLLVWGLHLSSMLTLSSICGSSF